MGKVAREEARSNHPWLPCKPYYSQFSSSRGFSWPPRIRMVQPQIQIRSSCPRSHWAGHLEAMATVGHATAWSFARERKTSRNAPKIAIPTAANQTLLSGSERWLAFASGILRLINKPGSLILAVDPNRWPCTAEITSSYVYVTENHVMMAFSAA